MSLLDKLKLSTQGMDRQKEFIFWVLKYGAVFVAFLFFFVPLQSRVSSYSSEQSSLKRQIEDLKQITTNLLSPSEVDRVRMRVEDFEKGLGDESKTNLIINEVTRIAETNHLKMIQIYSDSPSLVRSDSGQELEVGGKKLQILPVNFRVEADYKSLARFLKALSDDSTWTFTVESMQVQMPTNEGEGLQCDLTLNFITR